MSLKSPLVVASLLVCGTAVVLTAYHSMRTTWPAVMSSDAQQPKTEARAGDESTKNQAFGVRHRDFERMLVERRSSLQKAGLTVFEFNMSNTGQGPADLGCLIGEMGNVYTYDERETPGVGLTQQANQREYNRALDLAKSLGDQKLDMRHVKFDAPQYEWMVSIAGGTVALKASGVYQGDFSDPSAVELVKLISGWCPLAAAVMQQEEAERMMFIQTAKLDAYIQKSDEECRQLAKEQVSDNAEAFVAKCFADKMTPEKQEGAQK
jgi:hypothetical protein